ncbi:MAG TPA: hypothetical protein VF269_03120 [Rhodanobacteraceae bacterium]
MRKWLCATLLASALLAPAAFAGTPSFNYIQLSGQHVNASATDGWGWVAKGSFNPAGGWFVSGVYRQANHVGDALTNPHAWHADAGYKFDFADTLAAYGELGWSRRRVTGDSAGGAHVEVGLRARLPLVQLEGAVGRYQRNGGFNEYAATALFHVLPFTYVAVGYVSDHHARGVVNRWQAGLRLTF